MSYAWGSGSYAYCYLSNQLDRYVSSTFSNDVIVVDGDPNNDGDPEDASIAGRLSLVATSDTKMDDKVTSLAGTGGQGVLPIPIVYNGWVQNLPDVWKEPLTVEQRNPVTTNNTIYGGG